MAEAEPASCRRQRPREAWSQTPHGTPPSGAPAWDTHPPVLPTRVTCPLVLLSWVTCPLVLAPCSLRGASVSHVQGSGQACVEPSYPEAVCPGQCREASARPRALLPAGLGEALGLSARLQRDVQRVCGTRIPTPALVARSCLAASCFSEVLVGSFCHELECPPRGPQPRDHPKTQGGPLWPGWPCCSPFLCALGLSGLTQGQQHWVRGHWTGPGSRCRAQPHLR